MAVLRTLAFLGLACLQHSASAAADEFCMVQKNAQLNQAAMQPQERVLPDDFKVAFNMMHETLVRNLTQEEWKKAKMDLLLALKNKNYVGSMYMGLKNWTASLSNFSGRLVKEAQNLMAESSNATQRRAYVLLEHYTLLVDNFMANLAGSTVEVCKTVFEHAPPGLWRNHTYRARQLMANLTKEKVSEYVTSAVLRPQTKRIFDQRSTFCPRFMVAMVQSNGVDSALATMLPGLAHMKEVLPLLGPEIGKMVPEVQADVMRFANISLDALTKTFGNVNLAYHLMTKVMVEVAATKLNCTMPANASEFKAVFQNASKAGTSVNFATAATAATDVATKLLHSGAPGPRGLSGLAAVAALAAAAWLAGQ